MILVTALLVSLSVLMSSERGYGASMATREEQEAYLTKYGYMGYDPRLVHIKDSNEKFKMAVKKFQWMSRMNETGIVDDETVKMMEMPRCGNPDMNGMSMVARRRRRYAAIGSRWSKTMLTYRINNYTPDLQQDVTDSEIEAALKRWSEVSPLTFIKETDRTKQVDIKISFGRRNHGDGSQSSFDGPGRTLAHAYYPQSGEVHFDEDEQWTSKTDLGINLLWVAIHEFGHTLGLDHSNFENSIMAAHYTGYKDDPQLHADDIAGIQFIYGSMMQQDIPESSPSTPISPNSTEVLVLPSSFDICRDPINVDAIFAVNEKVYVFKGADYYMGHRRRFLSRARSINADWPGLPDDIDTAVYLDGSIVFFKGNQCWRYNISRQPIGRNPQDISTVFAGLPSNISAAFVWSGNGKLYFIKGEQYYRMSRLPQFDFSYKADSEYPQPLHLWPGLPSKIDAAFNYTNGRTYFFSGSNYYRFNDVNFKVDAGYPLPTATHWLGCSYSKASDLREDYMEKEWMAGGDQFVTGGRDPSTPSDGVGLPTYSAFLSTIAMLASCLLLP